MSAINNGSMTADVPGYPGYVLATKNIASGAAGGYVIYDPTGTNTAILNATDGDTPFSGKPVIYGDLLITGERINGRIVIVDISDLQNPNVVKTIPVTGNPDIPITHNGAVLVPLGYQGLVKFDLGELDPRQEQDALTVTVDTQVTMADETQTVTVTGGSGEGKLSYSVSDETVATVDENGKLTYHKPGSFTVTVTKDGDATYRAQTVTSASITVCPIDLSGAEITLSQREYTYDGTEKKPTVTVGLQHSVLTEGVDYRVSYANNRNAGTATATVTFCGSYTGTASATFTIAPKPLTVTAAAANKAWDGTTEGVVLSAAAEGIVTGDDVTLTWGTASFASGDVGENIPVTFSGFGLEGKDAANYTLTQPAASTANITVAKAAAEVEEQIKALPDVQELSDAQKEQVRAVKAAFDALSPELQKQISASAAEKLARLVQLAEKKPAVTPSTGDSFALLPLFLLTILSATAALLLMKCRKHI